jgi:hypothetical protein
MKIYIHPKESEFVKTTTSHMKLEI